MHSPNKQAKNTPWAGLPIMAIGTRTEIEAKNILATWIDHGVLLKGEWSDPKNRNKVGRITVNNARANEVLAEIGGTEHSSP
jgi:hypothetical protein